LDGVFWGYADGCYYSWDWANYIVAGLLAIAAGAGGWGWETEDVGLPGQPDVDLLSGATNEEWDGAAVF
tara:strand:+ start:341 stop:547 length:207 start_codon:yes stop_codon:yes gene_type:complete